MFHDDEKKNIIDEATRNLKLTAFAPENGWLKYDCFLLGWPIFRGDLLVSGRVTCLPCDNHAINVGQKMPSPLGNGPFKDKSK